MSPDRAASQLVKASEALVFSHNDASSSRYRACTEAGLLPARAARALNQWMRESTVKQFSYVYPQYYLALRTPGSNRQRVWGICSDGHGNLVGVLVPRDGVEAWDLPLLGSYRVYVCDSKNRKALSEAVMVSLADAGYDEDRLAARKAAGLDQERYLVSKPLTDEEQKRLEELRKQDEEAQKAVQEKKAQSADLPSETGEEATPMSDEDTSSSDDTDEGDSGSDEGDSSSDSSEEELDF